MKKSDKPIINFKRISTIEWMTVCVTLVIILHALFYPIADNYNVDFLLLLIVYTAAEILSVNVSDNQSIGLGSTVALYVYLFQGPAFTRNLILIALLLIITVKLITPRFNTLRASFQSNFFLVIRSSNLNILSLFLAYYVTPFIYGLNPRMGLNIFSRTAIFSLVFFFIKLLLTITYLLMLGQNLKEYLKKHEQILIFDALITNSFFIISLLSLLTIIELVADRYQAKFQAFIIYPLFILGSYLVRNRHLIGRAYARRASDLELLNTLTEKFTDNLNPDDLAEVIYEEIAKRIDSPGFYVGYYDQRRQFIRFPITIENGERLPLNERKFLVGMSEYLITQKKSLILNRNPVSEANYLGTILHYDRVPPTSYLGVPIIYEGRVFGIIGMRLYDLDKKFDENDLQLIETIARAAGIAIQNAQQFDLLQKQTRELTSLSRVSSIVDNPESHEDFIASALKTVIDTTGAAIASASFLDTKTEKIIFHSGIGISDTFKEVHLRGLEANVDSLKKIEGSTKVIYQHETLTEEAKIHTQMSDSEEIMSAIELHHKLDDIDIIGDIFIGFHNQREIEAETIQLVEIFGSQITIAFSNSELLSRIFQRRDDMEALYKASSDMVRSLSVDEITNTVAHYFVSEFDFTHASLWLIDEADRSTAKTMKQFKQAGEEIEAFSCEGGSSLRTKTSWDFLKRPIDLSSLSSFVEAASEKGSTLTPEACGMVYPMLLGEILIGFIILGSEDQVSFSDEENAYVQVIANQAAVAVFNAQLYERSEASLQKRIEELDALESIMYRITRGNSIDTVASGVVEAAYQNTNAEIVELMRFDDDTKSLTLLAHVRDGVHIEPDASEVRIHEGLVGASISTMQTINCPDIREDGRFKSVFRDTLSELVIPLILDEKPIGVLNLESKIANAFNVENERFITNLARQASIAIQNINMIDQISQQAEEFRALRNIAISMLSSQELKEMLHLIVHQAVTYTNAENIHIYLFDPSSDELRFGASEWRNGEADRDIGKAGMKEMPSQVIHSGQLMFTADRKEPQTFKSVSELFDWRENQGAENIIIGIPLRQGDQVIGVFDIVFDSLSYLNEETLHFLELLAAQAAEAITKVRYEEAVRITRDRLEAILNSTNEGIAMFDKGGHLLTANRRVKELFGINTDELESTHFARIFSRENPYTEASEAFSRMEIARLLRDLRSKPGGSMRREYKLQRSGLIIEETSYPVLGEEGDQLGWIFIFRDITQQRELEVYRLDMSNMIVHDLRSPLSGVITGIQMALSDILVSPDSETKHFLVSTLSIASQSANSLLELVENILDVNKLESGDMPLILEPVYIPDVIESARAHLEMIFKVEDIEYILDIPEDLPKTMADIGKLERVLINLFDNSLHFTPRNGKVKATIRVHEDGTQQVTISDSGPGIARDMRQSIFERFTQDKSRQRLRGGKGSGLGLTFCKLTIETHGGRIWVAESELGGATIHFTIPADTSKMGV